jgi:hypothetical protein
MDNKSLIKSYLDALSGREKTPALIAKYVADPALAVHIAEVEAAFPAYELNAEQMLGEADMVVVRGTFRGVHRGPFAGVDPTGKTVSAGLIIIYQVENEQIVRHWMQFDLFSLLQQLADKSAGTTA